MTKLKRCPFCGGEAHIDFARGCNTPYWGADGFEKSTPILYRVFCGSCSCQTQAAQDTDTAIKIWNRRADT